MLTTPSPTGLKPIGAVESRALFGKTVRGATRHGYPIRQHDWIDDIPHGITVYCGHEQRSKNGKPVKYQGRNGGQAVFMDTGAGKGGHLAWIDLSPESLDNDGVSLPR